MESVGYTAAWTFRVAVEADAPILVDLLNSAYRGEGGWTTEAGLLGGQRTDLAAVAEVIGKPDSRLLTVGGRDGVPLACCHLENDASDAIFGMFAVRPDLQGQGLGGRILAEAERFAREQWRADQMRMRVLSVRDDMIAWYQRRGYRRTGVFTPFPYGDARFGLPKRSGLVFETLVKDLPGPGWTPSGTAPRHA